jgi:hypothetical protein
MSELSKEERLSIFLERLSAAPPAGSAEEALELLSTTLNEVEDELTDIPYMPENSQSDGRMYPPQEDNARDVPGHDDVVRYRSRAHNTFIRANGAIEIRDLTQNVIFTKSGSDGIGVGLEE